MNQQTTLFSNEKLMAMIIPLFLEQLLIMLVGMADTLVVSYAGERGSIRCFTGKSVQYYFYLFCLQHWQYIGGAVVIPPVILVEKKNNGTGESAQVSFFHFSAIFFQY